MLSDHYSTLYLSYPIACRKRRVTNIIKVEMSKCTQAIVLTQNPRTRVMNGEYPGVENDSLGCLPFCLPETVS